MSLDFAKTHKLLNIPSGYQRLLLDVLKGNQSLFLCREEIELAWRWCDDAIEAWDKSSQQLHTYPSGNYGPEITKAFIEQYGHHWHED
jgi:glucose-6-phosphate 1-dehydrogenase